MYRYHRDEDEAEAENLAPIVKAIKGIGDRTESTYSAKSQVEQAFLLGLWYKSFPEYMLEHIETAYCWNHKELMPEGTQGYAEPYKRLLCFRFISNTGDSWHQCYRDTRSLGWKRLKVHREGGRLQYLFSLTNFELPAGFHEVHLVLDIAISTCKQVQIGTETKEVPIMQTVCEDLVELSEEIGELYPGDGLIEDPADEVAADAKPPLNMPEEQKTPRADEDSTPF